MEAWSDGNGDDGGGNSGSGGGLPPFQLSLVLHSR